MLEIVYLGLGESAKAVSVLIRNTKSIPKLGPKVLRVDFGTFHHDFLQISPCDTHFADVYILGMDFLYDIDLSVLLENK